MNKSSISNIFKIDTSYAAYKCQTICVFLKYNTLSCLKPSLYKKKIEISQENILNIIPKYRATFSKKHMEIEILNQNVKV